MRPATKLSADYRNLERRHVMVECCIHHQINIREYINVRLYILCKYAAMDTVREDSEIAETSKPLMQNSEQT